MNTLHPIMQQALFPFIKTTITQTGDYNLSATCTPVQRPPGSYHLELVTQLATARDPLEHRRAFAATLTTQELTQLINMLKEALTTNSS